MARRRKTRYTGQEWRRKFGEAAKYCSEEAKRRGIRFQDCVREYLARVAGR
jgi:hypothetical protein